MHHDSSMYADLFCILDLTAVAGEVSLEPQENMQRAWQKVYPESQSNVVASIQDAVEEAKQQKAHHVLVCGSLHLVGGVMSHLKDANLLDDSLNAVY
jgi:folylpolyglutamate synthase